MSQPPRRGTMRPLRDVRAEASHVPGVWRSDRVPARYCEAQGCGKPTEDRKPGCSDHLELGPHAARLLRADAAERAAAEVEAVEARRCRRPSRQSAEVKAIKWRAEQAKKSRSS